jgi:hypothetical protein
MAHRFSLASVLLGAVLCAMLGALPVASAHYDSGDYCSDMPFKALQHYKPALELCDARSISPAPNAPAPPTPWEGDEGLRELFKAFKKAAPEVISFFWSGLSCACFCLEYSLTLLFHLVPA